MACRSACASQGRGPVAALTARPPVNVRQWHRAAELTRRLVDDPLDIELRDPSVDTTTVPGSTSCSPSFSMMTHLIYAGDVHLPGSKFRNANDARPLCTACGERKRCARSPTPSTALRRPQRTAARLRRQPGHSAAKRPVPVHLHGRTDDAADVSSPRPGGQAGRLARV